MFSKKKSQVFEDEMTPSSQAQCSGSDIEGYWSRAQHGLHYCLQIFFFAFLMKLSIFIMG
jgi:hypothetical protein